MVQSSERCSRFDRIAGFTLLEVMIAMAVLAISLVAVFQMHSQSVAMEGRARFETTAALLAQSKMAEVESMKPEELGSGSGDFGDDFPGYIWSLRRDETDQEHLTRFEVRVANERLTRNNEYAIVFYRITGTEPAGS